MRQKIKLSGVPETMLQTVYARAKESSGRGAIHDAKAEEIVERLDYDFSLADKDTAMPSVRLRSSANRKSGSIAARAAPSFTPHVNFAWLPSMDFSLKRFAIVGFIVSTNTVTLAFLRLRVNGLQHGLRHAGELDFFSHVTSPPISHTLRRSAGTRLSARCFSAPSSRFPGEMPDIRDLSTCCAAESPPAS